MKTFLIKELNEKGREALEKHVKEMKKLSLKNKLIFKTSGYRHEIISNDPIVICLTIKNKYASNPAFLNLVRSEITNALKENGAEENKDYSVEVQNE